MAERIVLPAPSDGTAEQNISAPTIDTQINGPSNTGAPILSAPIIRSDTQPIAPEPNTSIEFPTSDGRAEKSAPEEIESAPYIDAPNSGAPDIDEDFDLRDLLIRRTRTKSYVVHPVSRIEDVFTSAERDLLKWLWERGRPVPTTERIRLVTGPNGEGARRLATQAGLIYNTFKNLTRALSTKLAVDIVKPERNLPTIYAIYHYSSILERQRLAGFTGAVHKNGGGRELVNTKAEPAARRPDLTVDELQQIIGARKSGAPKSHARAPNFAAVSGNFGAPKIAAYIRNKEYTSGKENTTPTSYAPNPGAPTIVVDALFQRTGRTDIDAARLITKGCQEANASVQPDEIARLIRTAQIPTNIMNPVGLLIRALPGRCAAESIANYREQWRKEDEQEGCRREQETAQTIETARSILDSVAKGEQWDSDTIDWAKNIVANDLASRTANR
jgi:hypothetical protein